MYGLIRSDFICTEASDDFHLIRRAIFICVQDLDVCEVALGCEKMRGKRCLTGKTVSLPDNVVVYGLLVLATPSTRFHPFQGNAHAVDFFSMLECNLISEYVCVSDSVCDDGQNDYGDQSYLSERTRDLRFETEECLRRNVTRVHV
jgi:hypothetical protein